MKLSIAFVMSVVAISMPVSAQTADHAPTKPAADAAAKYDRSVEKGAPDGNTSGPKDSSPGSPAPTNPSSADKNAPSNNGAAGTEPAPDKPK